MNQLPRRNIAIFGSTGSIGTSTLEVIRALGPPFRIHAVAAHQSYSQLDSQIDEHHPSVAILTDTELAERVGWSKRSGECCRSAGPERLIDIAQDEQTDIVVAAIVGSAGLMSCLAAAEAGKRLALANKEALVVAGALLTDTVRKRGAEIIPVDSEHSAIFQALHGGSPSREVRRVVLTASGGPLRHWPLDRLPMATPSDALSHPTWQMGKKITVDSATMMNKALEIVEAKWLFGVQAHQIEVMIHPQSVIHSMVEFVDGAILAQMSPPDMRLPIQYALTYPDRVEGIAVALDWSKAHQWELVPADLDRYPALELGFDVAAKGGSSGAVLNAANEAAVGLFLDGRIAFTDITRCCRQVLHQHHYDPSPSLAELLAWDDWARKEVRIWAKISC